MNGSSSDLITRLAATRRHPAEATDANVPRRKRPRGGIGSLLLIQGAMMLGLGLWFYADAAEWFSSLNQKAVISAYSHSVETAGANERHALLDAAYSYNQTLTPGPLLDPFVTHESDAELDSERYRTYEEMLRVTGTDAIGSLTYPDLDIALPIFHGTLPEVIETSVGHLYGTSLPVGGPGTHSVLTSHSGLKNARLFTNLLQAEVGQQFWISVLGEDHYYEVRRIETVLPNQVESLVAIPGEDWVTLFTCEPIGVNSHRFLVQAQRVPAPSVAEEVQEVPEVSFPWWAVWFTAGSAATASVLWLIRKRETQRAREGREASGGEHA